MNKVIGISLVAATLMTGCAYTESALQYAKEGTARVDSGYKAKTDMTKALVSYLQEANKSCGTTMEVVDGKPVVNVKECVRVQDVLASVDKVEIVKPQQVNDMLNSAGDLIMKATNMVVPVAGVYYNYRTHEKSMEASVANTASNNALQGTIFENFENTTVTTTDTSVSNTTSTSSDSVSVTDSTSTTTDTSITNVADTSVTDGTNTTTIGD
jgi:cyclopropane fatty-acyl-phospholipid synthase-like methyltransferase